MTKNHIKKRSSRSNKEHPGCMGSILHLFDFPSGKKLLTNKTHGDVPGVESPRISLDVSNDFLETPKSRDAKNEYGLLYDSRKVPATKKKAGGLPMKALIAEEMSKELEAKRRTPSVVARLMGLDTFPTEAMLAEHMQESDEPQKIISGKHQQQPKSGYDAGISPQKSRTSVCKEISFPKSQQKAPSHRKQRAPSCDQPEGKHMYEFKNEFEASQGSTCHDHSKNEQMDEFGMQLVEKQMLVHEMLDESKMAFVRQKFIDAKHLATDETLQQSEEFLDALGVLKSNKDLFLKFLQEPNSLFAKHLQDLQSASQMTSEAKNAPKMKSSSVMIGHEVLKKEDISQGRYSKEGKKHDKLLHKQKGPGFFTGRDEEWRRSSKDQCSQYSGAGASVKSDACSLPTRIVVLKPGPGSAQNARPTSPPIYSPQSQTAFKSLGEDERASTRNFLEEVRERLKMGLKETRKDDSKYTQESVRSRIHDGPKDPREIAREIARQVRESVTRDLTKDHSRLGEVSTSFTSFNGKKNSLNGSRDNSGELGICRDTDVSTPVTKHSSDYTKRSGDVTSSHPLGKSPNSSESTVNKEAKKRLSERLRLTHANEEEQQSRGNSSTLGKMLALREDKKPICQPKSSRGNNKINYGTEENQLQVRHESGTDCEDHWGGDENGNIPTKSLLRSPSIPESSTDFDRDSVEMQSRICDVSTGQAHEIVSSRSSINLPTELYEFKNNESVFKGNDSSLEGSMLLWGRSNSRKSDSLMQPDTSLQVTLDEGCDVLPEVLYVLENQETCKQSIDARHMESEPHELLEGITSETLTVDSKDSEETAFEPLDWALPSVQSDALQFGDNADYVTEGIPSEQPLPNSPTSCSSPNELPHPESRTSEVNNEKTEQPSPVSVLDSPFQEETPSPKGFKEISSNLQDLRIRLRLLKFDGSEKTTHEAENVLRGDGINFDDHYSRETEIFSGRICNSPTEAATSPSSRSQSSTLIEKVDFESLELDGIGCPEDKHLDLLYVTNVLVASGFTGDRAFSRWYLPNNPLDPSLFEKIENHCGYGSELGKTEANESKWERRLLFGCIDEVLLEILGPFFNHHPWVRNTKLNLRSVPAGKQLLRETWAAISRYLYTESENCNTLENIVEKDLAKEGVWMQLQNYVEIVGCELERDIYSDLIEDVIFDLVS